MAAEILLSLSSDLPNAGLAQLTRDLKSELSREGFTEARGQGLSTGDKGDLVTIGAIVLAAFSSGGAVVTFIKCVQAVLARDRSLSINLKFPKGSEIQINAKNVSSSDLHAAIRAAVTATKSDGFLTLPKTLSRLITNHQKTHCGNDRKLAR